MIQSHKILVIKISIKSNNKELTMKLNTLRHFALFLLSLFIISSCTLQKRKHLPGYSIDWNHKKEERINTKKEAIVLEKTGKIKIQDTAPEDYINPISEASGGNETNTFAKNIYKVLAKSMIARSSKDSCDNLITKEGEEFQCKVVEIGVEVIKYKRCNLDDSPLISIPRSSVLMIRYSNGNKEIIKEIKPKNEEEYVPLNEVRQPKKRMDVMGIIGFALTLTSIIPWWLVSAIIGLVAGVLGIVFGIISIARITKRRESRKGLGFAIVSLILGVLLIALTFIIWAAAGII
ncbi:DUF4190 domain-containing protein [Flavobacteriales bacterium]|nr:DUF4190 domain-containing protein [Flavobacteriales bacterium]